MANLFYQHDLLNREFGNSFPIAFVRCAKDQMVLYVRCYFSGFFSVPLVYLFWYQCHAVLITVAVWYTLKSGSVMPPALVFLLRIVLAMWTPFWFHMKFKVFFPSSVKKVTGSFMGIALNLQITLGSMAIFTILILPNHEHGMFLHLFVSSHFPEQWFVVLLEESFTSFDNCS